MYSNIPSGLREMKREESNDFAESHLSSRNELARISCRKVMRAVSIHARKKILKHYVNNLLRIRKQYRHLRNQVEFRTKKAYSCGSCRFRFSCMNELLKHLMRPTCRLLFRCQLCYSVFETVNICQIVFHCTDQHINEAGNYPKKIPIELLQAGSLNDFVMVREVCPECRKGSGSVISHLWCSKGENPVLECPYCNKFVTRNQCRFNLHIRLHNSEGPPFRCPDCAKLCKTSLEINLHMKEVCKHMEQKLRYKCPICKVIVQSSNSFLKHVFTNHSPVKYNCTLCPAQLTTVSEKNLHYNYYHIKQLTPSDLRRVKSYSLSHKCAICGQQDLKGGTYERHVRNHAGGPNFKIPYFMCSCGFLTMFKGIYVTHRSVPCLSFDFAPLYNSSVEMKECNNCFELKVYSGLEPFICERCQCLNEDSHSARYRCSLCFKIINFCMNSVAVHLLTFHRLTDIEDAYNYVEKISDNISSNEDNRDRGSSISEEDESFSEEEPLSNVKDNDHIVGMKLHPSWAI